MNALTTLFSLAEFWGEIAKEALNNRLIEALDEKLRAFSNSLRVYSTSNFLCSPQNASFHVNNEDLLNIFPLFCEFSYTRRHVRIDEELAVYTLGIPLLFLPQVV